MGIGWKAKLLAAAICLSASLAQADVVKVGVIAPLSGPYSLFGKNFQSGLNAWAAEHGTTVGDHEIRFVYRDEEGPDPARSKALAQELIVKEKVQYLAGFYFTPNAIAASSGASCLSFRVRARAVSIHRLRMIR